VNRSRSAREEKAISQSQSDGDHNTDLHQQMMAMARGYMVSQTIRTTIELSIPDHLAEGPLTAAEVAERESSAPATTYRLMRACVTLGLVTADSDGRFHGTPLLDTLRSDAPRSIRNWVMAMTNSAHWLTWNSFGESVRSGHSQARNALGMSFFDYLEQHPAQAAEFSAGMSAGTAMWGQNLADAIDTTGIRRAVDVGGANGALLSRLQEANAELQGVVFDRPNIAESAKAMIAESAYASRTDVVGGDFFESVPSGDLYLLKFILHDWDDESCVKILRKCREAMAPDGRIAIIELIIGDDNNPGTAAMMDLNMLACVNGRERSLEEFDVLLERAGLRRTGVRTTGAPQSVIEAIAA